MEALSLAALGSVPDRVARPRYQVAAVRVGIVHLGLGAFHRAHQAIYTDAVLARDPRWGICGVSLKTPHATRSLAAQDGLYTALEKDQSGTRVRIVGALREALFLGAEREKVLARCADRNVHVVTLTVTEKGYCHDPATGALDLAHPDIVRDLAAPRAATSAPGFIVAALAARRRAEAGPVSVVCCDNLPHNGRVVAGIVTAFARAADPALADWIERNVAFPSTMVDRIVPATTPADIAEAGRLTGLADAVPVVFEPFRQWVIEDRFAGPRPAWEDDGAQIVTDVAPFETMKLRLLNGSHSTLAYLGFLAGHEFIWQASADPALAALIERQMADEIAPTLVAPPGVDLASYRARLMMRFRNPALPHRTQQIAMDGSQKLPQRLLGTVRDRIARGAPIRHLALAVAGWIRYASGTDEAGAAIAVSDPLADEFRRIARAAAGDPTALAAGFLDLRAVFGDLGDDASFRAAVTRNVVALFRTGVRRTLAENLKEG